MEKEFGVKELYSAVLKATSNMEINGRIYEKGEIIASFDKIQIANFEEVGKFITAHGGYKDADRVFWYDTNGVKLNFVQGIFSRTQFAILSNARLTAIPEESIEITQIEEVEVDENGMIEFSEIPTSFFCYNKETNEKIDITPTENNKIFQTGLTEFTTLILHYTYEYSSGISTLEIGKRLTEGFLSFEGRTKTKDDITGQVKTGIIKIPKLKLMSSLSLSLGRDVSPVVAEFCGLACPYGARGEQKIVDIHFLNDDIDSDIQ